MELTDIEKQNPKSTLFMSPKIAVSYGEWILASIGEMKKSRQLRHFSLLHSVKIVPDIFIPDHMCVLYDDNGKYITIRIDW